MASRHAAAGAGLRAGLHDAVELARHFDDPASLPHVVRDRLLDINIFAGLHGPDGAERVPVVRRGEADDINVLVLQQLADVGVSFDLLPQVPVFLDLPVKNGLVHVAQRDHAGAFDLAQALDVVHAASAKPDDGKADVVVRAGGVRGDGGLGFALRSVVGAQGGEEAQGGCGEKGGFEETAAVESIHNLCNCSLDAAGQAPGYINTRIYFAYC